MKLPDGIVDVLKDANRVKAVEDTTLIGTTPDEVFDKIGGMSALAFNAPVAQVTLVHESKIWLKSSLGFNAHELPVETSFCAYTIGGQSPLTIVLDASNDERFANNPFVAEEPKVRFYAGCKIVFKQQIVGTVCVYDFEPRDEVTKEQTDFLQELAMEAANAIEEFSSKSS